MKRIAKRIRVMESSVVPTFDGKWGVRNSKNLLPICEFSSREKAIKYAVTITKPDGRIIIHKKCGYVEQVVSPQWVIKNISCKNVIS